MSSVSNIGVLAGANSSGASAARRAASASVSFGQTLQGMTDRANADAFAAKALTSANPSSVHDAPKPDDTANAGKSDDAQASTSADASGKTDAAHGTPKHADRNDSAEASKSSANAKPANAADAAAKAAAEAKARAEDADPANADADDTTLTDAATAASTDGDASATGDAKKTTDAKSAQDALQAALASMNGTPANAAAMAAAAHAGGNGANAAAGSSAANAETPGTSLGAGAKGGRGITLTNAASGDAKNAAAATATQAGAAALTTAQDALTPAGDGASAAYKQSADAAAHAVAMQAASANSGVSSPQGAMTAATSAAIAPHVGASGWDDAFSQKVVFVSKSDQQSAELTLNPKDLGPLQVTLQVADNHAHALFVSQHAQVREAVEAAMPKLREAMEANGISLGSTSVSDGSAFARQSQQDSGRQGSAASGGGNGRGAGGGVEALGLVAVAARERGLFPVRWVLLRGTCFRVGLLALPLPGAGVTFLAVDQSRRFSAVLWSHAKKVTKESSFFLNRTKHKLRNHFADMRWHSN
ncbi:Flagellar hook-length control protein [Burkholderia sp. 8Y]|uniref:flagellar hook-length control protein FliK n=1 Tax=Burkholderia sp. 8Y TaxID=2653133 RepID=UPI0012EEE2D9|nr:flagellar hook-length control protein FliK [Burkholderia sp. 8Y]VXC55331.1 Flagellar hook-length control protein [Burkholderia sp. 8Y]